MLVDLVLLIGGVSVILGIAVLGRIVRSFAKGAVRARRQAAGPGGGPPSVTPELVHRSAMEERGDGNPPGSGSPG